MTLPANRPKIVTPAKINVQKSVAAARAAGINELDMRKLLASGRLGRTIPDRELREIGKGIKFDRWAMLKKGIAQCDKKLSVKGLTDELWVAINKAKTEYLSEMAQLSQEMDDIANTSPSAGNGQAPAHSFGPREQIGNVTALQVNIGTVPEKAPVTDESPKIIPHQAG